MSTSAADFGTVIADKRIRYGVLVFGIQAGMVKPDDAAREILADLTAAGVDLRGGIGKWRTALEKATGQHFALIDALERLLPPDGSAPARESSNARASRQRMDITVRDIGRR